MRINPLIVNFNSKLWPSIAILSVIWLHLFRYLWGQQSWGLNITITSYFIVLVPRGYYILSSEEYVFNLLFISVKGNNEGGMN